MQQEKVYETTYIVTPDLNPSDYQAIVDKFNKILTDNGAKISTQEVWGLKKLAYEIDRKTSGYYVFTEYTANEEGLNAKLEREYVYDERLMRFLTIRLDKHGIDYANRRKQKIAEGATRIRPSNAKPQAQAQEA